MPTFKISRCCRVSHLFVLSIHESYLLINFTQIASLNTKSSGPYPSRHLLSARCKITLNSFNGRRGIGTNTILAVTTTPSHGGKALALHQFPLSLTPFPARAQEPAQLHEEVPHRRQRRRRLLRRGGNGRPAEATHHQQSCKKMRSYGRQSPG